MLGNSFGRMFRVTCCGESYGDALLTIVDGVPAGLELTDEMIQAELDKRRPGQTKLDSPRLETDQVKIVAGMLEGRTTGAPIGMTVYNVDRHDIHVQQYRDVKDEIRPGHAEYTFCVKYGEHADWCGAGRASGRETASRVAGGAVAKQLLLREGIEVFGHIVESHGIKAKPLTFEEVKENYRKNDLNCCDLEAAQKMIDEGILEGVDAVFGVHVWNTLPVGQVGLATGPMMAAVDSFEITLTGQGGHGAMPHQTLDPLVAACHVVTALQTIVSRSTSPLDSCVVTVGKLEAGDNFNIIPHTARLSGTCRAFSEEAHGALAGDVGVLHGDDGLDETVALD